MDPARQFASPYVGMGNNPVVGVDPDGRDCPSCPNDQRFDAYRNNNAMFGYDPDIGVYSDMGVGVTGTRVLMHLDNQTGGMTDFTNSNWALNIGGATYGAMEGLTTSQGQWLGKNGKYYLMDWGGNGSTGSRAGAVKAAGNYRLAGRATIAGSVLLGGYMTYEGYVADGGEFGYNAQMAAASSAGGIVGGIAGAKAGALIGAGIGAWFGGFGAIPGAVIGGVVGGFGFGLAGGYYGGELGKSAVNSYHGR